jgi:hypothetical protein
MQNANGLDSVTSGRRRVLGGGIEMQHTGARAGTKSTVAPIFAWKRRLASWADVIDMTSRHRVSDFRARRRRSRSLAEGSLRANLAICRRLANLTASQRC